MPSVIGPLRRLLPLTLIVGFIGGCTPEQRTSPAPQPMTAPRSGPEDLRVPLYQDNYARVSQGGRYFVWYGCGQCHDDHDAASVGLATRDRRHGDAFADVYAFIARGHAGIPPYERSIPIDQLWQLTAYVRSLPDLDERQRRRQSADLKGEPAASTWTGPLR